MTRLSTKRAVQGLMKLGSVGILLLLLNMSVFGAISGNNLPWEAPLTTLVTSLTGPVAYAISVVAIVATGALLAFGGGEMNETMRRLLQVGLAVCMTVFAAQVMSSFIGQGAEVARFVAPVMEPVGSVIRSVG